MSISFLPTIENLPVPRNVRLRGPLPPQPAEDIDVQIQKAKQAAGVSSSNNNFDNNTKQNQQIHDDADDYNNSSSEVSSSQKLLQQPEYRGDVETELFYDPACIDLLDCLDEKECLMAPVLHECVFAVDPASSSSSSSSGNTNTTSNKNSNNYNNNNNNNGNSFGGGCNPDSARLWLATLLFLHSHRFRLAWWIDATTTNSMEASILDLLDALDPSGCSSVIAKSGPLAVPVLATFAEFHEKTSASTNFGSASSFHQHHQHHSGQSSPFYAGTPAGSWYGGGGGGGAGAAAESFRYPQYFNNNNNNNNVNLHFPYHYASSDGSPTNVDGSFRHSHHHHQYGSFVASSSGGAGGSSSSSLSKSILFILDRANEDTVVHFLARHSPRWNCHIIVIHEDEKKRFAKGSKVFQLCSSTSPNSNDHSMFSSSGSSSFSASSSLNKKKFVLPRPHLYYNDRNQSSDDEEENDDDENSSTSDEDDDDAEDTDSTESSTGQSTRNNTNNNEKQQESNSTSSSSVFLLESSREANRFAKWIATCYDHRRKVLEELEAQRKRSERQVRRKTTLLNALSSSDDDEENGSDADHHRPMAQQHRNSLFEEDHNQSRNAQDLIRRIDAVHKNQREEAEREMAENRAVETLQRLCGNSVILQSALLKIKSKLLKDHSVKELLSVFLDRNPTATNKVFGGDGDDNEKHRSSTPTVGNRSRQKSLFASAAAVFGSSGDDHYAQVVSKIRQQQEHIAAKKSKKTFLRVVPGFAVTRFGRRKSMSSLNRTDSRSSEAFKKNNKNSCEEDDDAARKRRQSSSSSRERSQSLFASTSSPHNNQSRFGSLLVDSTSKKNDENDDENETVAPDNNDDDRDDEDSASESREQQSNMKQQQQRRPTLVLRRGSVAGLMRHKGSIFSDSSMFSKTFSMSSEGSGGRRATVMSNTGMMNEGDEEDAHAQQQHDEGGKTTNTTLFERVEARVKLAHFSKFFDEDSCAALCSIACDQSLCSLPENCALALLMCITLPSIFPASIFPKDVVDAWLDVGLWIQMGDMIWVPEEVIAGLNSLVGGADLTKLMTSSDANTTGVSTGNDKQYRQKSSPSTSPTRPRARSRSTTPVHGQQTTSENHLDDNFNEKLVRRRSSVVTPEKLQSRYVVTSKKKNRKHDADDDRNRSSSSDSESDEDENYEDPRIGAMNKLILLAQPTALEAVFVASSQWLLSIQRAEGGTNETSIAYWNRYQNVLARNIQHEARIRMIDSSIFAELFTSTTTVGSSSPTKTKKRKGRYNNGDESDVTTGTGGTSAISIVRPSALLLPKDSSQWGVSDVRKMRDVAEQLLRNKRLEDVLRAQENILGVFLKLMLSSNTKSSDNNGFMMMNPSTRAPSFGGSSHSHFYSIHSAAQFFANQHQQHQEQQRQYQQQQADPNNENINRQQQQQQQQQLNLGSTIAHLIQATSAACLFKQLATLNLTYGNGHAAENYCKKFSSMSSILLNGREDNPAKGSVTMFLGEFDYLYSKLESRRALALSNSEMLSRDVFSGVRHNAISRAEHASRKRVESSYELMHEAIAKQKFNKVLPGLVGNEMALYHRVAAMTAEIGLREAEAVQHAKAALKAATEVMRVPPSQTEHSGVGSEVTAASRVARCFDSLPLFLLLIAQGKYTQATEMLEKEPFLAYCGFCTENRFDTGRPLDPTCSSSNDANSGTSSSSSLSRTTWNFVCNGRLTETITSAMHFPKPEYYQHLDLFVANLLPIDLARHHGLDWSGRLRRKRGFQAVLKNQEKDINKDIMGDHNDTSTSVLPYQNKIDRLREKRKRKRESRGIYIHSLEDLDQPVDEDDDDDESDEDDQNQHHHQHRQSSLVATFSSLKSTLKRNEYKKYVQSKMDLLSGSPLPDERISTSSSTSSGSMPESKSPKSSSAFSAGHLKTFKERFHHHEINEMEEQTSNGIELLKLLVNEKMGVMEDYLVSSSTAAYDDDGDGDASKHVDNKSGNVCASSSSVTASSSQQQTQHTESGEVLALSRDNTVAMDNTGSLFDLLQNRNNSKTQQQEQQVENQENPSYYYSYHQQQQHQSQLLPPHFSTTTHPDLQNTGNYTVNRNNINNNNNMNLTISAENTVTLTRPETRSNSMEFLDHTFASATSGENTISSSAFGRHQQQRLNTPTVYQRSKVHQLHNKNNSASPALASVQESLRKLMMPSNTTPTGSSNNNNNTAGNNPQQQQDHHLQQQLQHHASSYLLRRNVSFLDGEDDDDNNNHDMPHRHQSRQSSIPFISHQNSTTMNSFSNNMPSKQRSSLLHHQSQTPAVTSRKSSGASPMVNKPLSPMMSNHHNSRNENRNNNNIQPESAFSSSFLTTVPMYLFPLNLLLLTAKPFDGEGLKFLETLLGTGIKTTCCSPHDMRTPLHICFDRKIHLFAERLLRVPGTNVEYNAEVVLQSHREGLSTRAVIKEVPNPRFAPLFYVRHSPELVEAVLGTHPDAAYLFRKYLKFFLFRCDMDLMRKFGRKNLIHHQSDARSGEHNQDDDNNNMQNIRDDQNTSGKTSNQAQTLIERMLKRKEEARLKSSKKSSYQKKIEGIRKQRTATAVTGSGSNKNAGRAGDHNMDNDDDDDDNRFFLNDDKLLVKTLFDPRSGSPAVRRLLIETLLVDELDSEHMYSIFHQLHLEDEADSKHYRDNAQNYSERERGVMATQLLEKKVAKLTSVCRMMSDRFIRHRNIDPMFLARLGRELLTTTFEQTVALLTRTSNLLLTRVVLEHLFDCCESRLTNQMKRRKSHNMVDLGYESRRHSFNDNNDDDHQQIAFIFTGDPRETGADVLEENLFPALELHSQIVAKQHQHALMMKNQQQHGGKFMSRMGRMPNTNTNLVGVSPAARRSSSSSASATLLSNNSNHKNNNKTPNQSRLHQLTQHELYLLENLFKSYRLTKRTGSAILLLHLFPELESILPPNEQDPFLLESEAWKRENLLLIGNDDDESNNNDTTKQRRRSSNSVLASTSSSLAGNDHEENHQTNVGGNSGTTSARTVTAATSTLAARVADESAVIDRLLNDAEWLARKGSPFVEDEKSLKASSTSAGSGE